MKKSTSLILMSVHRDARPDGSVSGIVLARTERKIVEALARLSQLNVEHGKPRKPKKGTKNMSVIFSATPDALKRMRGDFVMRQSNGNGIYEMKMG